MPPRRVEQLTLIPLPFPPETEARLVALALALGAADVGGQLSNAEEALIGQALPETRPLPSQAELSDVRGAIERGADPLGSAVYALRSAVARRQVGAIYTPVELVRPMVQWVLDQKPTRVVDAGSGSGRFSLAVAQLSPETEIVAVDSDPLATLLTRAALAAVGHARAQVLQADYTRLKLPAIGGRTAFLGNPPYVRHHSLQPRDKAWAQAVATAMGHTISGLAGLHAYFFLATAVHGNDGDLGCFVTSAEWLDVNYGAIVRELLLGRLGGLAIHVLEPTALPFAETATTAAITCFRIGDQPKAVSLRPVKALRDVGKLSEGKLVARERLTEAIRWTPLVRTSQRVPRGHIELGELCRVHRGAVTGQNAIWVTSVNDHELPPEVLFPSITKARELFAAGDALRSVDGLRLVIDLPADLDLFGAEARYRIEAFLKQAKQAGTHQGYIARNRRTWWSVGLRDAAPILATYMARRPPAFVRNVASARHINIAHGLYPREPLTPTVLDRLALALRTSITVAQGRTYAGGLTKFEPKEMERLPVPDLQTLTGM